MKSGLERAWRQGCHGLQGGVDPRACITIVAGYQFPSATLVDWVARWWRGLHSHKRDFSTPTGISADLNLEWR